MKASKPPRSTALSSSKLTVLLAALVFSLTACDLMSAEDSKTPSIQQKDKPAQATRSGEQVFADTCAFCHGHYIAPGLSVGPELRGRNLPAALTKTFVRNGVGAMPAFRPTEITDAELDALANWVANSKTPPLPAMPLPPGGPNEH